MMDENKTHGTGVEVPATIISPKETGDDGGQNEGNEEEELEVPLVLEPHNFVLGEVTDISDTGLAAGLHDHPPNVRPDEAMVGSIRIKVGIGITVMSTVTPRPPLDGALNGASASHSKRILERLGSVVRAMCPETMVSGSYAKTSTQNQLDRDETERKKSRTNPVTKYQKMENTAVCHLSVVVKAP